MNLFKLRAKLGILIAFYFIIVLLFPWFYSSLGSGFCEEKLVALLESGLVTVDGSWHSIKSEVSQGVSETSSLESFHF